MSKELNTHLLATMIKKKRGDKGLRAVAEEIGDISAPTLSRIEQGKVPDVDTFLKICRWLDMAPEKFAVDSIASSGRGASHSTRDIVIANLRADKELSKETISVLVDVIEMAYKFKQKK